MDGARLSPDIVVGLDLLLSVIVHVVSDRLRIDLIRPPVLFATVLTGLATPGKAFPGERKKRALRVVELHREVLK